MITEIHASNKIYIKFINTKKGWGVFCKEKILKDEIVEQCYGIIDNYETTPLKHYCFVLNTKNWQNHDAIMPVGYGAIYNHSDTPNITWQNKGKIVEFIATQDIEIGEEICHNYGEGYLEKWSTRFI
jgi:SET domain-containing protein